jgi:hypothetical protein
VSKEKNTKYDQEYGEKTEKHGKWDKNTVWPGIWQETLKNVTNEKNTVRPGIWQENWKNVENKTQTLFDMENGEKHWKTWKMRNAHCWTWIMARKVKIMENEKHTL